MKIRFQRVIAMAPILAAAVILAPAQPAAADITAPADTDGIPLKVHSGPGTRFSIVGTVPDGFKVTITCQTTGDSVQGTFGASAVWDKITTGGYVPDAYVDTGTDKPVAPPCDGGSALVDDYPYNKASYEQADPWNFYKRECVSFVAWRLRKLHGIRFHNHYKGVHWGNANRWDEAARKAGIKVDRTPAVGAVAQWNPGPYGHVAYVARVSGDWVTLEEYNMGGRRTYSTRTVRAGAVENYIHIAADPTARIAPRPQSSQPAGRVLS
ncbi:CHAP domain-containing protein [Nonomuraea sp. SYSU D8015]|uniref:CHAP domain-containing protein n=1 Tax=Nonomuraea sp. SYSU D8015 TaxID=2593644 RepID=UPI0021D10551|nr:CHAP domain-containing protein [Nonomuraea sp. SYSU D8015]